MQNARKLRRECTAAGPEEVKRTDMVRVRGSTAGGQVCILREQVSMVRMPACIRNGWPKVRWDQSKTRENIPMEAVRIFPVTDAGRFRSRLRRIPFPANLPVK